MQYSFSCFSLFLSGLNTVNYPSYEKGVITDVGQQRKLSVAAGAALLLRERLWLRRSMRLRVRVYMRRPGLRTLRLRELEQAGLRELQPVRLRLWELRPMRLQRFLVRTRAAAPIHIKGYCPIPFLFMFPAASRKGRRRFSPAFSPDKGIGLRWRTSCAALSPSSYRRCRSCM